MHYRNRNELALKNGELASYVHKNHRRDAYTRLNNCLHNDIQQNSLYTRYKNEKVHTVEEVMSLCPMFLNTIAQRKYKRILFVGHFDAGQLDWLIRAKSEKIWHLVPPHRSMDDHVIDYNIVTQFIPVIAREFNYDVHIDVVSPPESRHRQLMHSVYQQYGIDTIRSNKQYKHGVDNYSLELPEDHELYDAVVFAGVPKKDDEGFGTNAVGAAFQPYCKYGFEMFDLFYGDTDEKRWVDAREVPLTEELTRTFSNRAAWDDRAREYDLSYDYFVFEQMCKLYR